MPNFVASEKSRFWIDWPPFSGTYLDSYITDIDGLPGKRELVDMTNFGATGRVWSPSLQSAEFSLSVLYSEDTHGTSSTFGYLRTATFAVNFQYYPATAFNYIVGNAWVEDYTVTSKVGDAVRATIKFRTEGAVTVV